MKTEMTGTSSGTARVPIARWDLKEAVCKTPASGTRNAYEAGSRGRECVAVQSPIVIRTGACICERRGVKVTRLTLGDLHSRRSTMANRIERCGEDVQKSADGKSGHRSDPKA